MANIQTEISKIDRPEIAAKKGHLMKYQTDWAFDMNRFKAAEKAIRIGLTYAQEFAAVRGRIIGNSDYLHSSVTQGVALQFIRECEWWINEYKVKGITRGETDFVNELENNTLQRALYIEFPSGKRIVAFSSSPNSMRGFGGEVGLDEIAFHRYMALMMKGAGGRALWGDPVSMWSSHNGEDSDWNQFLNAEKLKGAASKWSLHRITILDAIEQGLVEKINQVKGTNFTRQSFLEDCEAAVGSREAFEEECLCEPKSRGESAISWFDIQAAQQDFPIYVAQIEGDAQKGDIIDPAVKHLLQENPFAALDKSKMYSAGFDIARTGHLASITILETDGKSHRLAMHVKLHKCKYSSMRETVALALDTLRSLTAEGDEGGLGNQICEELKDRFPGRFTGVNFSTFKQYIGGKLTGAFGDGRIIIPKSQDEVAYDVRGIKTKQVGTRVSYTESKNPINEFSHCDIAWSLGMAITNAEDGNANGPCEGESAGSGNEQDRRGDGYNSPDNDDDERKTEWAY